MKKFIAWIQILAFFTAHLPVAAMGADATPTPTVTPSTSSTSRAAAQGDKACEDGCTECEESKRNHESKIRGACGPSPLPGNTPTSTTIENMGRVFKSYSECRTSIDGEYEQLCAFCETRKLIEDTKSLDVGAAAAYTIATAACAASCAAAFNKLDVTGTTAVAMELACAAANIAALGVDIASSVKVTKDGQNATEFLHSMQGFNGATIGLGGLAGATQAGGHIYNWRSSKGAGAQVAKEASEQSAAQGAENTSANSGAEATTGGGAEGAEKATEQGGAKGAEKAGEQGAAEGAEKVGEQKAGSVADKGKGSKLSCVTAALLGVVTALKFGQIFGQYEKLKQNTCKSISDLNLIGSVYIHGGGGGAPNVQAGPKVDTGSAAAAEGGKSGTEGAPASSEGPAPAVPFHGLTEQQAAALASANPVTQPMRPLMDKIMDGQQDKINQLGNLISHGIPPSQALAQAMPDVPLAADMMGQIEDLQKQGKLEIAGLGMSEGMMSSGGGGGKGGGKSGGDPHQVISFLGSHLNNAKKAMSEVTFAGGATKGNALTAQQLGTDIYHPAFKGSVFNLVSLKISQVMNRVDQVEWATPLNRALMGLPKLSPSNSNKGKRP